MTCGEQQIFFKDQTDERLRELKTWLTKRGVRDFEPVSLFCDQLGKETVGEIELLADEFNKNKTTSAIKKAIVKGIPRQAVLKPSHAQYRLQNQSFSLGDRVTMVQDSGSVPLAAKGVVIGLNSNSMDVIWDVPFMSGTSLQNRCSQYRGSTVSFNSCLNLTRRQFVTSTKPQALEQSRQPFAPRYGPRPVVQPSNDQTDKPGWRPARSSGVHILTNPNRAHSRNFNPYQNGGHGPRKAELDHDTSPMSSEQIASRPPESPAANAQSQSQLHNGDPAVLRFSRGGGSHRPYGQATHSPRGRGSPNPAFAGNGYQRGARGRSGVHSTVNTHQPT